ncbi:TRAP transporter substrate-binding protein [Uliginosibacterium sp. sgz301328]|uniref:TRAP transporter substrate-binding protein n=1 Tax=Uliginosibacterium sp. sgz301328 TaxID=3243764 RepID=UPI00359E876A
MKKFFIKAAVVAMAVAGAASVVHAADYSTRIVRFGYGLNEDSNQGRAVRYFADEVGKRTGGKWKVKGFGAAALGSDPQMQNALIGGAQEMMVGSTATLVGIVGDFGVYDLPFIFSNEKEADAVLDGPFGQKLMDRLQEKGLVGLVYWENGFRDLTNSKHPITKMEDMQGIKLRVMQNPVYIDMFKGFGANAVPLAFSELFAALETKTVDGQENPVTTIESSKFYEVQKYLSLTHHVYSPWIVLASKKWWDGLSADEKKAVQGAAIASRDFERKDSREASAKAIQDLKQKGMQVTTVSPAELERMRKTTTAAVDKFSADGHAQVVKDLQAALAAAKK